MAKRLLLNVLLQVLGDIVEGLTEENLKVAVWSGEVVLENLTLSQRITSKFNLPFRLRHGVIKRLELIVPWGSLESKCVIPFLPSYRHFNILTTYLSFLKSS